MTESQDSQPPTRHPLLNATGDQAHAFPDWNQLYTHSEVQTLPWYHAGLDADLAVALTTCGLTSGRALDLGTGPGTQALALAERGFAVTASDLSDAAIARARAQDPAGRVDWRQDDILASGLTGPFALIFDRGCFHVLAPEQRPLYVATVRRLLADDGWYFLKCFSDRQPGSQGPYRFSPEQVQEIFAGAMIVIASEDTVYQGTLEPPPQALFCVLRPV